MDDYYDEPSTYIHRVGFDHRRQRYSIDLAPHTLFDNRGHDLVNSALEDAGAESKFFILPSWIPHNCIVLVSPQAYEAAVARGAVPTLEALNRIAEEGL